MMPDRDLTRLEGLAPSRRPFGRLLVDRRLMQTLQRLASKLGSSSDTIVQGSPVDSDGDISNVYNTFYHQLLRCNFRY